MGGILPLKAGVNHRRHALRACVYMMDNGIERNLGDQPVLSIMLAHGLVGHDLVAASSDQITHKMVSRACKGRRLSRRAQLKILAALNAATEREYSLTDLFNYPGM